MKLKVLSYTIIITTHLHAPISHVSVDKRHPGGRHKGVESSVIKVGIVLVPGNHSSVIVRGLDTQVPHWLAWWQVQHITVLYSIQCITIKMI